MGIATQQELELLETKDKTVEHSALTQDEQRKSTLMYYFLQSTIRGKAIKLLKKMCGNSFEAWRLFSKRYHHAASDDAEISMMQQIMGFSFGDKLEDVQEGIDDLDNLCDEYENLKDVFEMVSLTIKKAAMIKGITEPLKTHIQLNSKMNTTWEILVSPIEAYLRAKKAWSEGPKTKSKKDDGGVKPMDDDNVNYKGGKGKEKGENGKNDWKGKGNGKGEKGGKNAKGEWANGGGWWRNDKGKGRSKGGRTGGGKGARYGCGQIGHMQRDCLT
jgi:hypothetical protein